MLSVLATYVEWHSGVTTDDADTVQEPLLGRAQTVVILTWALLVADDSH